MVKNIKYTRLFFFFNQRNVTIQIQIKAKRSTANKSKYMMSFLKIILLSNIIHFPLEQRAAQLWPIRINSLKSPRAGVSYMQIITPPLLRGNQVAGLTFLKSRFTSFHGSHYLKNCFVAS